MVLPSLIEKIVSRIAEKYHPRRILLFGSCAQGDARPDSDIDLFVEMDTPLSPPERTMAIDRLFGLRDWAMDVVVYTPEEVSRLRGVHGTLLSIIEATGKVLYAKPGQ